MHTHNVEFEASHGTVADLWQAHLRGEETSMNPLGMVEAVIGALNHSAYLANKEGDAEVEAQILNYTTLLRKALHNTFRYNYFLVNPFLSIKPTDEACSTLTNARPLFGVFITYTYRILYT